MIAQAYIYLMVSLQDYQFNLIKQDDLVIEILFLSQQYFTIFLHLKFYYTIKKT